MHGLRIKGALTFVIGDYLLDYVYDGSNVDVVAIRHERMSMGTPDIDSELDEVTENAQSSVKMLKNPEKPSSY